MAIPDTIEDRIEAAEKRIEKLERKPRDSWDKFQIVASLLIPASITFAGYLYSQAAKQAEITSSQHIADQHEVTSQIQAKVGQGQLVSTFMDALVSTNQQKRRLAMEAVLDAIPEYGARLVAIVSQDTSSPQNQETARTALFVLDQRRSQLIQDCFSNDKGTRRRATAELAQGWQADKKLVPLLLEAARQNMSNTLGVIDVLFVLENIAPEVIDAYHDDIKHFIDSVRSFPGSETEGHVRQVQARLTSVLR